MSLHEQSITLFIQSIRTGGINDLASIKELPFYNDIVGLLNGFISLDTAFGAAKRKTLATCHQNTHRAKKTKANILVVTQQQQSLSSAIVLAPIVQKPSQSQIIGVLAPIVRLPLNRNAKRNYVDLGSSSSISTKKSTGQSFRKSIASSTKKSTGSTFQRNHEEYSSDDDVNNCLLYTSPSPRD